MFSVFLKSFQVKIKKKVTPILFPVMFMYVIFKKTLDSSFIFNFRFLLFSKVIIIYIRNVFQSNGFCLIAGIIIPSKRNFLFKAFQLKK